MRGVPDNALPVGDLPRATVPEVADRPLVQARIVERGRERLVDGVVHAWTADAVCVWWTDRLDCLRRIDWLPAADVARL